MCQEIFYPHFLSPFFIPILYPHFLSPFFIPILSPHFVSPFFIPIFWSTYLGLQSKNSMSLLRSGQGICRNSRHLQDIKPRKIIQKGFNYSRGVLNSFLKMWRCVFILFYYLLYSVQVCSIEWNRKSNI